jgi:transcriptional regulator with XRE-family HTH domain
MKLKEFLRKKKIKQVSFCREIGLSKMTLYNLFNYKSIPRKTTVKKIMTFTQGKVTYNDLVLPFFVDGGVSAQSKEELSNIKPSTTPQEELPNTKQLTHIQPVSELFNIDCPLQEVSNE